ncbi:MAG: FHA domain-containing protein [Actinomycetota bacterium]
MATGEGSTNRMGDGALIAGAEGAVLVSGPLVVVIGRTQYAPTSAVPRALTEAVARLEEAGAWTFDATAAALQDLVIEHNPPGVAALLRLDDDALVFLFDQASAAELGAINGTPGQTHTGSGRTGWTTVIAESSHLELRVTTADQRASTSDDTETGWAVLEQGVVPGSLARCATASPTSGAAPSSSATAPAGDAPAPAVNGLLGSPVGSPPPAAAPPSVSPPPAAAPPPPSGQPPVAAPSALAGPGAAPPAASPPGGAPPPGGPPAAAPPAASPPPGGPPVGAPSSSPAPPPGAPSPLGPPPSIGPPPAASPGAPPAGPPPGNAPPPPGLGTPPPPGGSGLPTPPPPAAGVGAPPPPGAPAHLPPPGGPSPSPLPPPPGVSPATPPAPGAGPGAGAPVGYLNEPDHGLHLPLTVTTVIGSDPRNERDVVSGVAAMLTIDDPRLNGAHVKIGVIGASVTVEDLSGGGTWVQAPGGPMSPLGSGPQPLQDGTILRLGARNLVFRTRPG